MFYLFLIQMASLLYHVTLITIIPIEDIGEIISVPLKWDELNN